MLSYHDVLTSEAGKSPVLHPLSSGSMATELHSKKMHLEMSPKILDTVVYFCLKIVNNNWSTVMCPWVTSLSYF